MQVAIIMQVLINRFRYLHLKRMLTLSESISKKATDEAPAELAPLMRGAWINKPSASAPRKRRFFQLSSDGSTLRWAWDKYILLYFVEVFQFQRSTNLGVVWHFSALHCLKCATMNCAPACVQAQSNDDLLMEIVLKMATEPDLHLKFESSSQYWVWKHGLAIVIDMLEQPIDVCNEGSQTAENCFGEAKAVPHGMLKLLLLESRIPGEVLKPSHVYEVLARKFNSHAYAGKHTLRRCFKQAVCMMSCTKTQRHSVQDPKMKLYNLVRASAM